MPASLKQTFYDDVPLGSVSTTPTASDEGEYKITLMPSPSTFTHTLQMLGTQADYSAVSSDVLQFGLYYRLRNCAMSQSLCTGDVIQHNTDLMA